jgi:hypothetical protein
VHPSCQTLGVGPESERNAFLQSVLSTVWNEGNRLARQRSLASSGAVALVFQAPSTWVAAGARAVRAPPVHRLVPITSPALAPKRGRAQMLARVTVPAPASTATARLLGGAGMFGGIITAMRITAAPPTPNQSFKRTCQGLRPCPAA